MFSWFLRSFRAHKVLNMLFLFGLPESEQSDSNAPFTLIDPSDVRPPALTCVLGVSRLACPYVAEVPT